MMSEAEVLERLDDLLTQLRHAKKDLDALFTVSQKLSDEAAVTMHDVDAARGELVRLSEKIEAGELSIDADSMRVLSRILDSNRDVISNLDVYRDVKDHIKKASSDMSRSSTAHEYVINQARSLMQ